MSASLAHRNYNKVIIQIKSFYPRLWHSRAQELAGNSLARARVIERNARAGLELRASAAAKARSVRERPQLARLYALGKKTKSSPCAARRFTGYSISDGSGLLSSSEYI